jgi:hypothetical protein
MRIALCKPAVLSHHTRALIHDNSAKCLDGNDASSVVGANLCSKRPLEVQKRGLGVVARNSY